MKPKIIISETSSRLIDSIKNNLANHYENIDSYLINMSEIFKAFDIIKSDHIILSYKDINSTTVKLFLDSINPNHPVKIIIEGIDHINIIDSSTYFNQNLVKNNTLAIILDENEIDKSIFDTLDIHNIHYHIFDAPNFEHKYNLGLLNSRERANIINQYGSVATFKSLYAAETFACGGSYYGLEYLNKIIDHSPQLLTGSIIDINQYIQKSLYVTH